MSTHKTQKRKISAKREEKRIAAQTSTTDVDETNIFSVNSMSSNQESNNATQKNADIDIESLKAELLEQVKKQIQFEMKKAEHVKEVQEKETAKHATSITKSEIILSSDKSYKFSVDGNGLKLTEKDLTVLASSKTGTLGLGTDLPRVLGKGSLHIRSGMPTESLLPTSGHFTTKGVLIETDAEKNIRRKRNILLKETDWTALSDVTMSAEMATYRQALRDISDQEGFPYSVVWPEKPL